MSDALNSFYKSFEDVINKRQEAVTIVNVEMQSWHRGETPEEAVTRWNTHRAAPVEGLETVARQFRWGGDERWRPFGPIFDDEPREVRELVTRSQAETIIASERTMRKTADQRLAQSQDDLKQARDDNAALTALVKELTGDRDSWRRVAEKLAGEKQALETQLEAENAETVRVTPARVALEEKP